MGMTAEHYLNQLQALLPPGKAWTREPDADLTKLLRGLAEEFARVDRRAEDLIEEADPRTCYELLPDWEEFASLPDACHGQAVSIEERRAALVARLTARGGQSRPFFIALAAALGYQIGITEYSPFQAGSTAGDRLTNGDWVFAWQVDAAESTVRSFVAGSAAGEPLASWGNELLECAINKLKPAHTHVLFAYGG